MPTFPASNPASRPSSRTVATIIAIVLSCAGCANNFGGGAAPSGIRVQNVNFDDITAATPNDQPVQLAAAKNEWTNFAIQITGLPASRGKRPLVLRIKPLNLDKSAGQIGADNFSAYQVLSMPIDVNQAGYVRHTGMLASTRQLPRALLPLKMAGGKVDLGSVRDPSRATDPQARGANGQPVLLWVDLHIPPAAPAGDYTTTCDVVESGNDKPLARVPLRLKLYDFVLPDERHLMMVGSVEWDDLARHYTDRFEAVTPRLMTRDDPRYTQAIQTLDQLVYLAQANRVQLVVPRLQPTVKWLPNKPPQVDWREYDSVVTPWLRGETFPDKTPFGYWPLPTPDNLNNYDLRSQREYWTEAASHFDLNDWLTRSAVELPSPVQGRADSAQALKISGEAGSILALNPRLRVTVPLEDDQVQFATPGNPNLVKPETANRLVTANPGLIFASPVRSWPQGVVRPARWLRTDLTGLVPYVGAGGDERDVRLWAWFASVPLPPTGPTDVKYGSVQFIRWPRALPRTSKPSEAADPNDLVWFYPGSWFGLDEPVPTLQLKWLRRAQQDYEYLYLARQRGETLWALVIARLMSKPVEIQPGQTPDPTFGLMSGTADASAWNGAIDLLSRRILFAEPGQQKNQQQDHLLSIELNRWAEPQERPVAMGRSVSWINDNPNAKGGLMSIAVRLGIDIYNDADRQPLKNSLQFGAVPSGWHYRPRPQEIEQLGTYQVARFPMEATVEPTEIRNTDRRPIDVIFTDGFTRKQSKVQMVLPIANCDRREGRLSIDGSLQDWSPDDAIQQDTPLVRMFSRPALQKQQLEPAATPSSIFTGWSDANMYVSFKLSGLSGADTRSTRNFVDYDFFRAWGEDLCELLVQGVYSDNTLGPVLHIVCKPNASWVERKMDPRQFANPWQPIEGSGVRYAATIDGPDWRGEVAIPWSAIGADPQHGRPVMLRFNFTQHKVTTGESSSWAGPIDFGRDENFMGLLIVREPNNPGMGGR